ncbi:hypothetical protein A3Q56_02711 [Intoshia linei]|uniref:Uncharacterized protein n=1 Tax=Intoshia linei TaxID=1819745 RepID=A0A177B5M0_9BILA|nr:hypothetical protein A3Q56_02711 [Intoshia linei]
MTKYEKESQMSDNKIICNGEYDESHGVESNAEPNEPIRFFNSDEYDESHSVKTESEQVKILKMKRKKKSEFVRAGDIQGNRGTDTLESLVTYINGGDLEVVPTTKVNKKKKKSKNKKIKSSVTAPVLNQDKSIEKVSNFTELNTQPQVAVEIKENVINITESTKNDESEWSTCFNKKKRNEKFEKSNIGIDQRKKTNVLGKPVKKQKIQVHQDKKIFKYQTKKIDQKPTVKSSQINGFKNKLPKNKPLSQPIPKSKSTDEHKSQNLSLPESDEYNVTVFDVEKYKRDIEKSSSVQIKIMENDYKREKNCERFNSNHYSNIDATDYTNQSNCNNYAPEYQYFYAPPNLYDQNMNICPVYYPFQNQWYPPTNQVYMPAFGYYDPMCGGYVSYQNMNPAYIDPKFSQQIIMSNGQPVEQFNSIPINQPLAFNDAKTQNHLNDKVEPDSHPKITATVTENIVNQIDNVNNKIEEMKINTKTEINHNESKVKSVKIMANDVMINLSKSNEICSEFYHSHVPYCSSKLYNSNAIKWKSLKSQISDSGNVVKYDKNQM